jgi:hypothetical protein
MVDASFRFKYDRDTGHISGNAEFVNLGAGRSAKGDITKGQQNSDGQIVITVVRRGGSMDGSAIDYTLERREDGSLHGGGSDPWGLRLGLSLTKKGE